MVQPERITQFIEQYYKPKLAAPGPGVKILRDQLALYFLAATLLPFSMSATQYIGSGTTSNVSNRNTFLARFKYN
jgi:hypothetical protein